MCKIIAQLSQSDTKDMRELLHSLEKAASLPGVDLRLTGEIYGQLHMKTRELGLDPNDTTAKELYRSLNNLAELHDSFLAKRLGVSDSNNVSEILHAVVDAVDALKVPRQAWVLKQLTIKKMLKNNPPKNLMKSLRYRSLDSMIKREPAAQLLTIARYSESPAWNNRLVQQYKNLTPNDFEQKDVSVVYLDELKWSEAVKNIALSRHSNIFYMSETGQILLTPLPLRNTKGLTLSMVLMVLHSIGEIRTQSSYLKFNQLHPEFSDKLYESITKPYESNIHIAGQSIPWKLIHKYYGSSQRLLHPEVFEPHVQPEDLTYRKAEMYLYKFEPALNFWHNLDYVGLPFSGNPVSFNIMDVSLNLLNNVSFEGRFNYHLRDAVWNEVLIRYVGQRHLERRIIEHLEDQVLDLTMSEW
jgi:hypothetical protein